MSKVQGLWWSNRLWTLDVGHWTEDYSYDQSPIRFIHSLDCSSVQMNCTLGDRESQPHSSCFAITRIIHAVKGTEDFLKCGGGNTGPVIPDYNFNPSRRCPVVFTGLTGSRADLGF